MGLIRSPPRYGSAAGDYDVKMLRLHRNGLLTHLRRLLLWDSTQCKDLDASRVPGSFQPALPKLSLSGAARRLTRSRDCVALSLAQTTKSTCAPTSTTVT